MLTAFDGQTISYDGISNPTSYYSPPVIPTLRLTTRGVVDVLTQQYV